jgi:molecular chaperone GrpE (heat shock protein)
MIKKFVIIGLLLLLVGAVAADQILAKKRSEQKQAAYYQSKKNLEVSEHLKQYKQWLQMPPEQRSQLPVALDKSGIVKTDAQLLQEQRERLNADIDELAAGETDTYPYADVLYGENWQSELNKHIKQKEQREFVFTCSIVLMLIGGTILICCFLIWIIRCIIRALSCLKKFIVGVSVKRSKNKPLAKADVKKDEQNLPVPLTQLLGLNDVSPNFKTQNVEKGIKNTSSTVSVGAELNNANQAALSADCGFSQKCGLQTAFSAGGPRGEVSKSGTKHLSTRLETGVAPQFMTGLETLSKNTIQFAGTLSSQIENLEKQVEEIRHITKDNFLKETVKSLSTKDVQSASGAAEHLGPLHDTLTELTQQVSAIREYASNQQNRIQKLQEGYDLNIIKNFCLRIIRCIDNIESCIGGQSEQDGEMIHLKELRDELLFALESSGVEQFEPQINSDYCGQERLAEAVKEKEYCNDPNLTGKIAQVIKPGYQYFIDEENVKVVRPAMVKLFG